MTALLEEDLPPLQAAVWRSRASRRPIRWPELELPAPVYLISEITEVDVWAADVALDGRSL